MSIDVTPTDLIQEELMALRRRVGELEHSLQTTGEQAAALRAELDGFNRAFDAAPIGMALVDSGGHFTRVNQTLCTMFGHTSDELTTLRFRDLAHPDERDEGAAQYGRMLAGESQTFRCEKRYLHADGHTLWLLLNVTLVRDDQNHPLHFWCQFEDITHRKQTELALQESERRLVQFMEVLPVGVFVIDNDGNPFYANQAAQQLLGQGIKPRAALSQLTEVYRAYKAGTDQEYPIDRTPIVRALSGERSTIDDMEIRQNGHTIPLEVTAAPIVDASGAVTFAIAIFTDITERRRVEETRRQSMLQDEIIRNQAASLQELSTPLIPISDQVLAMPLIGSIDSRRAQQVIENLLHGVAEQRATTVILDITGVAVVDTQVANALVRAAQAVQLLGAQVVLTGIRPEVAQTLVGLGVDLRSIITRGTLQSGIAFAIQGR